MLLFILQSDTPTLPPLKESFKEILVKHEGNEEILVVTKSETLINTPEPETKTETCAESQKTESITDQHDVQAEQTCSEPIQTEENSQEPINSPVADTGRGSNQGEATPTNDNLLENEPDLVPEVSIKQPVKSHHRRRRGARKSEKNKKLNQQNSNVSDQTENESGTTTVLPQPEQEVVSDNIQNSETKSRENVQCAKSQQIEKQPEWEMVPKEIIADPDSGKIWLLLT